VVAVLASACLEAPPGASGPGADGGGADGGADGVGFPPSGAAVHLTGAFAADVDNNGRDDLVLLDDDDGDDWVGVYILRAGEDGWIALDQVELEVAPTAAWFGRMIKAGPAMVVGRADGQVEVVDYKSDGPYQIDELVLDPPVDGPVTILHSGLVDAADAAASLLIFDGTSLLRSDPVDLAGTTSIGVLSVGTFLDAAFWPLSTSDPAIYIAGRTEDGVQWHMADTGGGANFPTAVAARFGRLVNGMCGTHLVVGSDDSLLIGSIACDATSAATDPLVGSDIPEVKAMMAADIGGAGKHDVVLVGLDGGTLYAQALIDINYVADEAPFFQSDAKTSRVPLEVALPETIYLVAADVEAIDRALVYAIAPSGVGFCGQLVGTEVQSCEPAWQLRGP